MSYRLINANALAANCKQINDMPCIYADLPNGLDGGYYDLARGNSDKSRWHELFGTPERAAECFAMQCFGSDGSLCHYCPFDDCDEKLRNSGSCPTVYDTLLEWLRGDA